MSSSRWSPPFDPREVGPLDVLRNSWERLGRFVDENTIATTASLVVLVGLVWHYNIGLPKLPNWALVAIYASLVALPPGAFAGWRLARTLYLPETVLLSVQNPVNGDQKLVNIAPDRFDAMTVVNHDGKRRERDFLHEVRVNGRRGYEVDTYDVEENRAVASWQAGVSNSEIRRDRAEIKRIKTSLEREADKALELLANHPDILRQQAREVSNRVIKVAEDVEVPQGGALHERLGEILDAADPSEELLGDGPEGEVDTDVGADDDAVETRSNGGGLSSDEALADIFERAKVTMNGHKKNGEERDE